MSFINIKNRSFKNDTHKDVKLNYTVSLYWEKTYAYLSVKLTLYVISHERQTNVLLTACKDQCEQTIFHMLYYIKGSYNLNKRYSFTPSHATGLCS